MNVFFCDFGSWCMTFCHDKLRKVPHKFHKQRLNCVWEAPLCSPQTNCSYPEFRHHEKSPFVNVRAQPKSRNLSPEWPVASTQTLSSKSAVQQAILHSTHTNCPPDSGNPELTQIRIHTRSLVTKPEWGTTTHKSIIIIANGINQSCERKTNDRKQLSARMKALTLRGHCKGLTQLSKKKNPNRFLFYVLLFVCIN